MESSKIFLEHSKQNITLLFEFMNEHVFEEEIDLVLQLSYTWQARHK